MTNIYKQKYNKYKYKYLVLKGGSEMNIYISPSVKADDANIILNKLKNKYINNNKKIYITNTYDDCNKSKNKYDKIILIADKEKINKLEYCSITGDVRDIIDYLTLDNFNLGLTYLFDGNSGMRKLELHKKLSSWDIKYGTPNYVDYLHIEPSEDGKYNKNLYNVNCILRNTVDINTINDIVNKENLYNTMEKEYNDYLTFMPETIKLDKLENIKDGEVLIIKPVGAGAHSGIGISIVTNDKELRKAKEYAKQNSKWKWIASKYIKNPLLFNGLKFHFRCYLMVTSIGQFYKFNQYKIITAKDKYKAADFANKNIHDSHASTTLKLYTYPKDISNKIIQIEVEKIMDRVINVMKIKKISGYSESKYGYDILGLDILFDDTYHAWLIEVNAKIGHSVINYTDDYKNFEKDYLNWEYNSIIKPTFSKIKLVPLEKINDKMIDELLILTTNNEIMSNIGLGELWNRDKILKIVGESKQDSLISDNERKYFNWVTILKYGTNKVVGYVGLRPMFKIDKIDKIDKTDKDLTIGPKDLQLRIFTYPSQGYGTNIINKIIKFINKTNYKLWATVHTDNVVSISFFKKLGWKYMGDTKISNSMNSLFLYKKID